MTPPLRRAAARKMLCALLLSSSTVLFVPAAQAQAPQPLSPPASPVIRQNGTDQGLALPGPSRYRVSRNGDVSLNYLDTDVREIARLILGEILKVNYSIDPGFQGTVTIQTAHPLRHDELLSTLQGLLTQAGGQLTYQDGIYRISAQGADTDFPPVVRGGSTEAGAQVVPLHYASAKQLATLLESYVGDSVKLVADPGRNALIVSGSATARQSVVDLVHVFDVDYLAGQSYALYPVKSGTPTKLAADLQAALQIDGDGALTGAVKVVPLDQANAVMVITRQPAYLDRVGHLMEQIDQIKVTAGRKIHVYYLKNTQPMDIQPLLQRAVNPPGGNGGEEPAPGNLPPTATAARIASPASGPGANATQPGAAATPGATGTAATGSAAAPTPAPSTADDTNQQTAGGDPKGPQIIADNPHSALIVMSTDAEYDTIVEAIRKLDILPMQVLVEATIAEVTLNKDLQYGVQFFLQGSEGQALLTNAQSSTPTVIDPTSTVTSSQLFPGILAPNLPGLAITRTFSDVQVALQALKTITDVQIVSAPKLLILDKQQATFQVGDLVPTITQSATSVITAGAPVVNNVQYQATGVILTVTPRVNSGGLVTLDIDQEVSDVLPTTSSSINSPTFQQRKIQTKVIVQDGETISLAGLISDKKTRGNSGVPLLQEIPVLGTLFSTKLHNNDRTELLVLLKTRIVHDAREARALADELKEKLAPSRILP